MIRKLLIFTVALSIGPQYAQAQIGPSKFGTAQVKALADKDQIGGSPATNKDAEYMVAILAAGVAFPDGMMCGGTIIADGWVLTAAHCLFKENCTPRLATELRVSTGRIQYSTIRTMAVSFNGVVPHESFRCVPRNEQLAAIKAGQGLAMSNDIALLKVPEARAPANPLLAATATNSADNGYVSLGWGSLSTTSGPSAILQRNPLPRVDHTSCEAKWSPSKLTPDIICAGKSGTLAAGVCAGDSGGPLIVEKNKESAVQVGVVSKGHYSCSVVDRPSLFTNVAFHRDWIEKKTGKLPVPGACTPTGIAAGQC